MRPHAAFDLLTCRRTATHGTKFGGVMKIGFFEAEDWERDACRQLLPKHDLIFHAEALNAETGRGDPDIEVLSSFVNSRLTAEVLRNYPRLKLVATRSTGYDHIDLEYCRGRGILVSNVPDYGDSTVAEHTFALLLAVARNLVEAVDRTRHGQFGQTGLRGLQLRGRTLGVIGTGRIGRRVIEIAKGFGLRVLAFDVAPDLTESTRLGFTYESFDAVLTAADILTFHVPATAKTAGLISDEQFGKLKPGAVLINTARGNVVDTPALVRALSDGRLRAAGLDVLPLEPLIREEAQIFRGRSPQYQDLKALVANHVLLRFPNVIMTPHIAYNTDEAVRRILEVTAENIHWFSEGRPRNLVSSI
jgi:D-lactate dehydrogenase